MTRVNAGEAGQWKPALGRAYPLWAGVARVVEELASPLDVEWKPSKNAFGHVCAGARLLPGGARSGFLRQGHRRRQGVFDERSADLAAICVHEEFPFFNDRKRSS